jgi:FkbM family methyltransferase
MPLISQFYRPSGISKKIYFYRFISGIIIKFLQLDRFLSFSNTFQQKLKTYQVIKIENHKLKFIDGNERLNIFYQTQFFIEKDLTKWIFSMEKNDVFYDIGSNVGIFTCLAGKKKIKTFSFECMHSNLNHLAFNIKLNNVEKYVVVLPFMLSRKNSLEILQHRDLTPGTAKNEIRDDKNIYNNNTKSVLNLKMPAYSLDSIQKELKLPFPSKIKIDVDGAEYQILLGMKNILKKTAEIMIELDGREQFTDKCLNESEFVKNLKFQGMKENYHSKKSSKHRDFIKIIKLLKKFNFKEKYMHGNNFLFTKI